MRLIFLTWVPLALCAVGSASGFFILQGVPSATSLAHVRKLESTKLRDPLESLCDIYENVSPRCESNNTMTPRAARIETPLKVLFSSTWLSGPLSAHAMDGGRSFEATLYKYFPKALATSDMSTKVRAALSARTFTRTNTLFGTSISPDEINSKPKESLASVLGEYVGKASGSYRLGGLGGLPLLGVKGMKEFLSHSPNEGKVFILFGPNVGISDNGVIGKLERLGQTLLSECCEPGLSLYDKLQAQIKAEKDENAKEETAAEEPAARAAAAGAAAREATAVEDASKQSQSRFGRSSFGTQAPQRKIDSPAVPLPVAPSTAPEAAPSASKYNELDSQQDFILARLREYIDTPEGCSVSRTRLPAFLTLQMFKIGQELIMEQLEACLREMSVREQIEEVVLLGGIIISRGQVLGSIEPREDYFQPLVFESYTGELDENGKLDAIDLFEATFGDLPSFLDDSG